MVQEPRVVIQTHNLTHRYGKLTAIQDVNLSVYEGEIFGFLGPNGAGKTTTIRTLLDFIRPSEGSASIFGLDTVRDSVAIRARVGYLPSELALLDNWTGIQYIRWLEDVRGRRTPVAEAERLAAVFDHDRALAQGAVYGHEAQDGPDRGPGPQPNCSSSTSHRSTADAAGAAQIMRETRAEGRTIFLSSQPPEVEAIQTAGHHPRGTAGGGRRAT